MMISEDVDRVGMLKGWGGGCVGVVERCGGC